jgi:hypothetical protein
MEGAKSAASSGARAEKYAADKQYEMWKEANDQFQPFLQAGQYGVANLQSLLSGSAGVVRYSNFRHASVYYAYRWQGSAYWVLRPQSLISRIFSRITLKLMSTVVP